MDSDCNALLPGVLAFLADPKQSLPDDSCLEKLLDWLTSITTEDGGSKLLDQQPCLLDFISNMCDSNSTDPTILSFVLKLTGLLAATERGFSHLEERGLVRKAFAGEEAGVGAVRCQWEDASVRCGWLLGLRRMLQHHPAMLLLGQTDLTRLILKLQCDRSLFVATAANQLLAHILNFRPLPPITNEPVAQASSSTGGRVLSSGGGDGGGYTSPEWNAITTEIMEHVVDTLGCGEHFRVLQALRLVAVSLPGCGAPLLGSMWRATLGPLEALLLHTAEAGAVGGAGGGGSGNLALPVMEVLQAASTTELFSQSEARVEELMKIALKVEDPKTAIQCAAAITRLQQCSDPLKRVAVGMILQPLEFITGSPLQLLQADAGIHKQANGPQQVLGEHLSNKSTCVALLSLCLSSVAELSLSNSLFVDVPVQLVTEAVLYLLRVCQGQSPSPSPYNKAFLHLIGCSRVQRCCLDAIISLSSCDGVQEVRKEVFDVLHQYLVHPDSDPTVLQKTLQAMLKWICLDKTDSSDQRHFLTEKLFPALMKRVCDVHWEVRDSTLEFITQLTVNCRDYPAFSSELWASGIISLLLSCLDDSEGYVRASAVSALGQAVAGAFHQGEPNASSHQDLPEEVLTRLTAILVQDTEGFPRRAVVKVFNSWLREPNPPPCLDQSISVVLTLAIDDFDWEVKVHALELAETLMKKMLSHGAEGYLKVTVPSDKNTDKPVDKTVSVDASAESAEGTLLSHGGGVEPLHEGLERLQKYGVYEVLFKGLLDCDRPVAQRACQLLLKLRQALEIKGQLKGTTGPKPVDRVTPLFHLNRYPWGKDLLTNFFAGEPDQSEELGAAKRGGSEESDWSTGEVSLADVLNRLDLEGMGQALTRSSDHLTAAPHSLLQDILAATRSGDDNAADCY